MEGRYTWTRGFINAPHSSSATGFILYAGLIRVTTGVGVGVRRIYKTWFNIKEQLAIRHSE